MPSRSLILSLLGGVLLVVLTACQSIGIGAFARTAPLPTAVAGTAARLDVANPLDGRAVQAAAQAQGRAVVWGAVTNCTCHDYVGTGSVSNAVDNAKIGGTVQEASETANSVYFYVTYDPKLATRDRAIAAIIAGGGRIKPGPPTSIDY